MVAEARMSTVAAGMSVCGDGREGGRDGPRERLVEVEPWALARVGEGDGMTKAGEEARVAAGAADEEAGAGGQAVAAASGAAEEEGVG